MRPPAALRVGAGACGPRRAGASCGPVSSLCRTRAGLLCCRWTRIASGTSKRDRSGAGAAGRGLRPEGRVQESEGREVERVSRVSRLRGPGGPELFDLPREAREVAPGAVHVPDWLSTQEQAELVAQCRGWSRGDHRMRHYTTSTGGVMSVQSTVLGRTWELPWAPTISSPERGAAAGEPKSPRPASGDRRAAAEGSTPDDEAAVGQRLPEALWHLGRRGVAAAYGEEAPEASSFEPTTALVNYYDASARMGQHQDLDEAGPEPIVSLSPSGTPASSAWAIRNLAAGPTRTSCCAAETSSSSGGSRGGPSMGCRPSARERATRRSGCVTAVG